MSQLYRITQYLWYFLELIMIILNVSIAITPTRCFSVFVMTQLAAYHANMRNSRRALNATSRDPNFTRDRVGFSP